MKNDNIVFVVGVSLDDLEKPTPIMIYRLKDGNRNVIIDDLLICSDYMVKIDIEFYLDLYLNERRKILIFNGIHWNINQFENYSNIGNYIVYISKDKKKAIDKIATLYKSNKASREKILEGAYFD